MVCPARSLHPSSRAPMRWLAPLAVLLLAAPGALALQDRDAERSGADAAETPATRSAPGATRPVNRLSRDGASEVRGPGEAPWMARDGERRLVADTQTLVFRASDAPPGAKTLSDIDAREAKVIEQINRKRGTYQSYLLYTSEDLPTRFFHPGFIITLPPPKKRPDPPLEVEVAPGVPAPPPRR